MNTLTPRTDEARRIDNGDTRPLLDEMETLERELHESRNAERLARVQLGNERAQLDDLISVNATGAARLAHATAQLATERARLDWLEKRGPWESWFQPVKEVSMLLRAPIREGIDAAMKEGAK